MRVMKVLGAVVAMATAGLLATGTANAAPAAPAALSGPAPVSAPAAPAPTLAPGTPCVSTARACVDLSANKAWLISNGSVTYGPVPITHGRKGYATPPGTFRVSFKDIDHVSSQFNSAPMPYSVFFNGGVAFHQGSLSEKSHGCVHLSKTAAKKFYSTLAPGDVVQVVP